MKKRIIAIAVAAFGAASLAAPPVDIPQDILGKQRHTLEHYGSKSKTPVPKTVAEGYSYRIGNMIKSLTDSKARFDAQKGSSQPSNPYAKYNGVWELTTGSGAARCSDGDTITLYQSVSRFRMTVASNGNVNLVAVESSPSPAQVLTTSGYTRISGGNLISYSETRYYWPQERYHSQQIDDYTGVIKSNSYITGNQNMQFYFEEWGAYCEGIVKVSLNKVAN
jgi:hypothetical protein